MHWVLEGHPRYHASPHIATNPSSVLPIAHQNGRLASNSSVKTSTACAMPLSIKYWNRSCCSIVGGNPVVAKVNLRKIVIPSASSFGFKPNFCILLSKNWSTRMGLALYGRGRGGNFADRLKTPPRFPLLSSFFPRGLLGKFFC